MYVTCFILLIVCDVTYTAPPVEYPLSGGKQLFGSLRKSSFPGVSRRNPIIRTVELPKFGGAGPFLGSEYQSGDGYMGDAQSGWDGGQAIMGKGDMMSPAESITTHVRQTEYHDIGKGRGMPAEVMKPQVIPMPYPQKVHVPMPYPQRIPVHVPKPHPVDRPYPVEVPYPVRVPYPVDVPRPYPVRVPEPIPFHVPKPYPVPVPSPYPIDFPIPKSGPIGYRKDIYGPGRFAPYPVRFGRRRRFGLGLRRRFMGGFMANEFDRGYPDIEYGDLTLLSRLRSAFGLRRRRQRIGRRRRVRFGRRGRRRGIGRGRGRGLRFSRFGSDIGGGVLDAGVGGFMGGAFGGGAFGGGSIGLGAGYGAGGGAGGGAFSAGGGVTTGGHGASGEVEGGGGGGGEAEGGAEGGGGEGGGGGGGGGGSGEGGGYYSWGCDDNDNGYYGDNNCDNDYDD